MLDCPGGVSTREGAVAFWFRRPAGLAGEEVLWFAGLPEAGGSGSEDAMIVSLSGSGRARFLIENGRHDVLLASPVNLGDDRWHHLVASWGPSAVELFVDGRRAARDDQFRARQDLVFTGTDVRFGKVGHNAPVDRRAAGFTGWVDEIALWNRPLTAPEVRQQFRAAVGRSQGE